VFSEKLFCPAEPRRVVITTTPFDACAPYCAAAEASLRISTEAMSSGLRFGFCCPMYIPSTTYSGFGLLKPFCPRMTICAGRPGWPLAEIWTPGARPRSASSTVATFWSWMSLAATRVTAPDTSRCASLV
jgi:hypothetical protein